jgi:TetR/AcrR family transcriptional regulator, transcriptional repressor for nem operon
MHAPCHETLNHSLETNAMPRPAEFNAEMVLDQAMLLFWTQGYAGTSIQDLVEGTELLRGSLYHSFGDKRSLYIQTLRRYGHLALEQTFQVWNSEDSVLSNVRAVLMQIVEMPQDEKRRGNMVCNCIVEVVPHDPEIATVVEGILDEFKRAFQSRLVEAQHAGGLDARTNTTALSRYLVSSIQGLCVTAKGGATREELLDIVEVTLSAVR